LPKSIASTGGKFLWEDDQETPNTQQASYLYGDKQIVFDVRNLSSPPEGGTPIRGSNFVGNIFFGNEGYMVLDPYGFQVYRGDDRKLALDEMRQEEVVWTPVPHMQNFIDAIRARDHRKLTADVSVGADAAALCHYANASYRLDRRIQLDAAGQPSSDAEAARLLTRDYREPYVVAEIG
jgi:hypothetical protein